jgi:hypothetical protein
MGLFSGIGEVTVNGGGVYLLPGATYEVRIAAVKTIAARGGWHGFVAEFEIVKSTHPDRPAGMMCSWMVKLDPAYRQTALANIKGFVAAVTGMQPGDIDEAGVEAVVAADNPLKGMRVKATVSEISKKNGEPFTKVLWTSVTAPEETK